MKKKQIVLSGIRPTGSLHLGNYFGAMKNFVDLQNSDEYQCMYFVADYHALTTHPDPKSLEENLPEVVLGYLSAGLDPEKSILYAQSSIPELAELMLLISMVLPIKQLLNCPTFKEKIKKQPENVNHGLLSYPVLMAADILGPRSDLVPVGEDQLFHVEIARDIARLFNNRYGYVLTMPQAMKEKAIRVPGLDGTGKMGKSDDNFIALTDSNETIHSKLRKAMTDPQRKRRNDPGRPWECNIFTLHELVSSKEEVEQINQDCRQASIGCVDCKKCLAKNVISVLEPIREKRSEILKQPDFVRDVIFAGGQKAREIIIPTVDQVRKSTGIQNF